MDKLVSLVIPTYNEHDNIVPLVEHVHKAMAGQKYEILFVDDNSRDGTADIINSLAGKYPVKVMVRKDKKGLASAVVDGFAATYGEVVGVMDADLQHPPEIIPKLVAAIDGGADIAIGSRYVPGGSVPNWSLTRRLISKGAIFLSHLFLPPTRKISDPMSGFFMLRRSGLEGARFEPTGYKILLEVLMEGKFNKVAEVPFAFRTRERGTSKLGAKTQIDYLKHLYSLMKRNGELTRFIKFCLVGLSGVGVNFAVFALFNAIVLAGIDGILRNVLATAISAETSVVTNFILNDRLTFRDRRTTSSGPFIVRLAKFNVISLVGIGLQTGCMWLFNGVIGWNAYLALAIGIGIATAWNYVINSLWTWK